jgi:hypothetical protein
MIVLGLLLLGVGIYATLLGFSKAARPIKWRGREETQWLGRFAVFFGVLVFLDGIGIGPRTISSWIQDILTSGGGVGTG